MIIYTYQDLYRILTDKVATVIFIKKNGDIRVMLCTRNIDIMVLGGNDFNTMATYQNGHDKRCSLKNGNIGVIDLILGEPRAFNIDRFVSIHEYATPTTAEEMEHIIDIHMQFKTSYESSHNHRLEMEDM